MLYREVARTQTYGASWKEITVNTGDIFLLNQKLLICFKA